jgi:cytochrome c peroxidase
MRNFNPSRVVLLGIVLAFSLMSCKKSESPEPLIPGIDEELENALRAASGGIGAAHFVLPNSNDFANIPQDPNNPLNASKVELGKLLFHETGIGLNPLQPDLSMEAFSCASCHHAQAGFQANIPQGIGEGGLGFGSAGEGRHRNPAYPINQLDIQPIRSPSALNVAYQVVTLWNGQFGAVGPNMGTEASWTPGTPKEDNNFGYHGPEIQAIAGQKVHRLRVDVPFCEEHPVYEQLFTQAFPGLTPEETMTRENAGLAIAAYERTLLANEAPFQRWLRGDKSAMTQSEKQGAILFFGKAECANCHNGPALAKNEFYAIGMKDLEGPGVVILPDAAGAAKGRGGFTNNPLDDYKFKVPQLYNLRDSKLYGHGASFYSVYDVIAYKNAAVSQNPNVPASQLSEHFHPLNLTNQEVINLAGFIENALHDGNLMRYVPNELPTGNCFPNSDNQSQADLGCE